MAAPTPIVTAPPDFLELPPGGTYQFTGSSSPSGASCTWTLVEWPPEATGVVLNNANTATPTLSGITARGTYIVFLKVTNSFGESHPQPYPIQATTAPYGFSTPVATAFGVLRIAEAGSDALNPIFKPGRGEYGWFEKGLWPLVKKVGEGLSFPYYDIPTRELTANSIVADPTVTPFTATVSLEGFSITKDDAQAEHELVSSHDKINVLSHTVVTGKDLTVSGGTLKADDISDASGGDITINANAGVVVYAGTGLTVEVEQAIDLSAQGLIAIGSASGNVTIGAGADIALNATSADGDITLTTQGATGNISLATQGSNADISITASGADGDIALSATGATAGISLLGGGAGVGIATVTAGANVSLTAAGTGGVITLTPDVSTNTTKPVFAPGFSYVDTYTFSGTGKPVMPEVAFTRHAEGSDMVVDVLTRFSLPKPDVAQLSLTRTIKDTEVTLATFSSDMSEGADNLYMRLRCVTRKVTDTKLVTHITCDTSDAITMELHTTRHVFATHTITTDDNLYPFRFNFVWSGDSLTDMDCCITAVLTNRHTQDVL